MGFRKILRKTGRAIERAFRILFVALTAFVVFVPLNVLLHVYLHVCPLHLARFERRAIVPVVYGRPMGGEPFARAARGKVVLGGCVVGPVSGVCPYCHWPTAVKGLADGEPRRRGSRAPG
jgi:hypothetical protein